jgi:orotate phosphoribosyltransferase
MSILSNMREKDSKVSMLNDLILFLFDKDAIKIGDFTLSSGKKSKFYLDLRILQSYPLYFRKGIFLLKRYAMQYIGLDNFDYVCSIPTSGTVFGSSLAYEIFKPHIYVRKSIKQYGTQKTYEGNLISNSKVLFVDDVMTTGNSLISSVELLKDKSVVEDALVFVDRGQGAEFIMENHGIKMHKIISMDEIFNILIQNNRINEKNFHELINESKKT